MCEWWISHQEWETLTSSITSFSLRHSSGTKSTTNVEIWDTNLNCPRTSKNCLLRILPLCSMLFNLDKIITMWSTIYSIASLIWMQIRVFVSKMPSTILSLTQSANNTLLQLIRRYPSLSLDINEYIFTVNFLEFLAFFAQNLTISGIDGVMGKINNCEYNY